VYCGGSPKPEALLWAATFNGAHFLSGFGMTETTATVTFLTFAITNCPPTPRASPMIRRLWSVGRESREYAHLACTTVHLAENRTRISGFTQRRVCARSISSILKFVIRAVLVIGGCRPC
jgi:hypothetical protein